MEKIKRMIVGDIWIVFLDIISVNAAYYLAFVIRFMVGGHFYESLQNLPELYTKFAPVYTVLCIIIFCICRLYGGMWRYAGISDINRIVAASVITTIINYIGTRIMLGKMPISFHIVGALLQLFILTASRFAYRFFLEEKKRMDKKKKNAMIIGRVDSVRYVISLLDSGLIYRPACVIDDHYGGMTLDGLPVFQSSEIRKTIEKYEVKCIAIAEVEAGKREELKEISQEYQLDLRDYTSHLNFIAESEEINVVPAPIADGRKGIPFSPPDISELEISEVSETLRSGWITTGPRTKMLERRLAAYIGTGKTGIDTEAEPEMWKERVACLSSATAAEELNLRVLGIREGDEVLVPAYTYTASASAVIHCGATVKFVDIQKDGDERTHGPEMDYAKMEAAITEKTKAVIVVDLGGLVCDYDKVFEIVERKKNLFKPLESDGTPLGDLNSRIQKAIGRVAVISDGAHALGASRVVGGVKKYVGAIADFTSFSFHAVKNFTTAEGGASTWRELPGISNAEIYKFYQLLSLHGQSKDALAKSTLGASWEYDVIGPWYKCNMTDIQAAIGLRQLDRYKGLLKRRMEIIAQYDKVCDELGLKHLRHHIYGMDSSNHLYLVRIPGADAERRNKVIEKMAKLGVSTNVHYMPLPMMTAYKSAGIENFPNTYDYYKNLFTLPLHTLLSDEDVETVCGALREVFKKNA